MKNKLPKFLIPLMLVSTPFTVYAHGGSLFDLSLEQLSNVVILSSARRPQPIRRASNAMYVITAEDIQMAGVQKLDDILRLVPGMDVAHATNGNGTFFAFSVRGFARPSSEQMQVLIDGRPLYNPYRGGVELSSEPIFAENIERIEVIRGSGGVVWGVNAMNGVVNIITKKTADTQGGMLTSGYGNRETAQGVLRYGGTSGRASWRVTTGVIHDNGFGGDHGDAINDYHEGYNISGRVDYQLSDDITLIASAGHRDSDLGFGARDPIRLSLQYVNFSLEKLISEDQSLHFRWSENFYDREQFNNDQTAGERMIEFHHNFVLENHNIVWGADYTEDRFSAGVDRVRPDSFKNDQASVFIQDEITLRDDLWLTLGYRSHYNEVTHHDWAGNVALIHEFRPRHFLRAAVSKAFRRPIMFESFNYRNGGRVIGNDNLLNEELVSFELGYRGQLTDSLELNIEGFLNQYRDLIGAQLGPPRSVFNSHDIKTYGVETTIDWRPKPWWLLRGSHSFEFMEDEGKINDRTAGVGSLGIWTMPRHKITLTNRFYLDNKTTLNTQIFWSDELFNRGNTPTRIPAYLRVDMHWAKKVWDDKADIAIGVTNLTDRMHYEGSSNLSEVPRIFYLQARIQF